MEDFYQGDNWKKYLPKREDCFHKGDCGKLIAAVGSRGMSGAAYLCAKAAYRSGCGLVYIYTPECNRTILQQLIPEAVLITYDEEAPDPEHFEEALKGKDALVIGCGLGRSEFSSELTKRALMSMLPCVADADALNLIAADPHPAEVCDTYYKKGSPLIITPHEAEMARLCGCTVQEIGSSRREKAEKYSQDHRVITVLKGHDTIITDGWNTSFNTTGNHGMATGGSGDVLAGVIGSLLAQGLGAYDAARLGAYIHGMAGDRVKSIRGTYSMMAGDIAENILYGIE